MGGFVTFWPIGFNIENYKKILGAAAFQSSFWISIQRAVIGTSINITLLVLTAYPCRKARRNSKAVRFSCGSFCSPCSSTAA